MKNRELEELNGPADGIALEIERNRLLWLGLVLKGNLGCKRWKTMRKTFEDGEDDLRIMGV